MLGMWGIEPDFDLFTDAAPEDNDVALLYHPQFDGVEAGECKTPLGVAHLAFEDRFLPFGNASTAVHPYSIGLGRDLHEGNWRLVSLTVALSSSSRPAAVGLGAPSRMLGQPYLGIARGVPCCSGRETDDIQA